MEQEKVIVFVTTADNLMKVAEVIKTAGAPTVAEEPPTVEHPQPQELVYGLRGIKNLFNVSTPTAIRYKETFLKPAIMQQGRKIVVDKGKAIELFHQNQHE
jgi:hypothetical protein